MISTQACVALPVAFVLLALVSIGLIVCVLGVPALSIYSSHVVVDAATASFDAAYFDAAYFVGCEATDLVALIPMELDIFQVIRLFVLLFRIAIVRLVGVPRFISRRSARVLVQMGRVLSRTCRLAPRVLGAVPCAPTRRRCISFGRRRFGFWALLMMSLARGVNAEYCVS